MFHPKLVRLLTLGAAVSVITTSVFAQATEEPADENVKAPPGFVLPPRLRQIAFRDANPWTFNMNVRSTSNSTKVSFSNLGSVPSINPVAGSDQYALARQYDDGAVGSDAPRSNEKDANGNVTSTPGGRYQVFSATDETIYQDLLAYTPGVTRNWTYSNDSQLLSDNKVAMHTFAAESTGASASADDEGAGLGFEMSVGRRIWKISKKTELSFTGSVGITDLKAETSGRVTSNLVTMTDVYQAANPIPTGGYYGPAFQDLFDDVGNIILANGYEVTNPLQEVTADRTYTTTPNGAAVDGTWKLKGAYYAIRIGALLRSHVTERLAFSAGVGVVGAYLGSDFTVTETIDLPDYLTLNKVSVTQTSQHNEIILGFYGEINAEFWITPRTAFFAGAAFESLDSYEQTVGGRTASVALGDNLVFRLGLITRF